MKTMMIHLPKKNGLNTAISQMTMLDRLVHDRLLLRSRIILQHHLIGLKDEKKKMNSMRMSGVMKIMEMTTYYQLPVASQRALQSL